MKERLEILKIHVSKWKNPPSEQLLEILAEKATGYCGSDLRALCTEAVLQGLRRTYPQIYMTNNRLLLDPDRVEVRFVIRKIMQSIYNKNFILGIVNNILIFR